MDKPRQRSVQLPIKNIQEVGKNLGLPCVVDPMPPGIYAVGEFEVIVGVAGGCRCSTGHLQWRRLDWPLGGTALPFARQRWRRLSTDWGYDGVTGGAFLGRLV